MKYVVQGEIGAENVIETEVGRPRIEQWIGKWQALNPIGMYFNITRRAYTIVVDVPDEDALFDALYDSWVLTRSYPSVSPVVGLDEFGSIMKRVGLGG